MNQAQFTEAVAELTSLRSAIVSKKRPEYTEGNQDVLHNFKAVGAEIHTSPMCVWYVYFRKHVASISQFASNPKREMAESIEGRIADAMNYLELLYALVKEEQEKQS